MAEEKKDKFEENEELEETTTPSAETEQTEQAEEKEEELTKALLNNTSPLFFQCLKKSLHQVNITLT